MHDSELDHSSIEHSGQSLGVQLFIFALGGLLGWGIARDRTWDDADKWAVETTRQCEASHKTGGYTSVTECVAATVQNSEEERRTEARAEHDDPR